MSDSAQCEPEAPPEPDADPEPAVRRVGDSWGAGDRLDGSWAQANWSAPATLGTAGQVRAYPLRGVWLIEVDSPYAEVSEAVDHTIQIALAESPRGVVCSLSRGLSGTSEEDLDLLAAAGRHVRSWPATPVVVACKDRATPELLVGRPGSEHLLHVSSMLLGWTRIMAAQAPQTASLHLQPGALAARSARRFFIRTCLDWSLNEHLAVGPLLVSELVTNAVQHARSDIDLFLAADGRNIRVGVRDRDPTPPVTRSPGREDTSGRGLRVVQTLAQAAGALPAADGGKFVWAVLSPEDSRS